MSAFIYSSGAATLGTYAGAPADPIKGAIHICTDSPLQRYFDGSTWLDMVPGYGGAFSPIPTTGWTSSGTAPTTTTTGGVRTIVPNGGQGGHVRTPSNSDFLCTFVVDLLCLDTDTSDASLLVSMTENATSESVAAQINSITGGSTFYTTDRPNGPFDDTGVAVLQALTPAFGIQSRMFIQLEYNSANVGSEVKMRASADGITWDVVMSEAVGTYFTSAPDRVGFGVGGSGTRNALATLYQFRDESA